MQKWPYVDFAYLNVEGFRSQSQLISSTQKQEYLTVEATFVSENAVMFFDHYAKEYRRQRSELDAYLEKLAADEWKLTFADNFISGKGYQFRRYQFRRAMKQ